MNTDDLNKKDEQDESIELEDLKDDTEDVVVDEEAELAQYSQFLRTYRHTVGRQASARWHTLCALWRRDNGRRFSGERFASCRYCQMTYKLIDLTVDHVIPKSRGGKSNMSNYVLACEPCNKSKANLLLSEWRAKI